MKLLHTSDWHLGHTFHRHHRDSEVRHFLSWLLDLITLEQPDVLLISGDIFDTPNPSAAAMRTFFDFLEDAQNVLPHLSIIATAGNHDSGARLESPRALLERRGIYLRGIVHRTEKDEPDYEDLIIPLRNRHSGAVEALCLALPYLRGSDYGVEYDVKEGMTHFIAQLRKTVRKSVYKNLPLIACAHYYASEAEISDTHSERLVIGGQDCIEGDIWGKDFTYVALGHIHKSQNITPRTAYAGSPLPMSFGERGYQHGVYCLELGADETEQHFIKYTPLRTLLTLPKTGAALPEKVLEELAQLPQRNAHDTGDNWPYLEVNVLEEQPEPELLHRIQELVSDKAVYLCRIARHTRASEKASSSPQILRRADGQLNITPLELAEKHFEQLYGTTMNDALKSRLTIAIEKALEVVVQ